MLTPSAGGEGGRLGCGGAAHHGSCRVGAGGRSPPPTPAGRPIYAGRGRASGRYGLSTHGGLGNTPPHPLAALPPARSPARARAHRQRRRLPNAASRRGGATRAEPVAAHPDRPAAPPPPHTRPPPAPPSRRPRAAPTPPRPPPPLTPRPSTSGGGLPHIRVPSRRRGGGAHAATHTPGEGGSHHRRPAPWIGGRERSGSSRSPVWEGTPAPGGGGRGKGTPTGGRNAREPPSSWWTLVDAGGHAPARATHRHRRRHRVHPRHRPPLGPSRLGDHNPHPPPTMTTTGVGPGSTPAVAGGHPQRRETTVGGQGPPRWGARGGSAAAAWSARGPASSPPPFPHRAAVTGTRPTVGGDVAAAGGTRRPGGWALPTHSTPTTSSPPPRPRCPPRPVTRPRNAAGGTLTALPPRA